MNNYFIENSILDLMKLIGDREISAKDLVSFSRDRIKLQNPVIHAWVSSIQDEVFSEKINSMSFDDMNKFDPNLVGIPFGAKDIFNTKEFSTEMGSAHYRNFRPGNNARVVDSLLTSGAVLMGKTATAEFAVHKLNDTLNPHDFARNPGTSSSGSAAAVAVGMVPFALASQTAGSIVRPSSYCGVWGMKPSFGLIPRTGVLKTTDSLDTIGFITTHGENLRLLLDVCRVKGPNYPFVFKNIDNQKVQLSRANRQYRVGFIKTHTWNDAEVYAKIAISEFICRLSKSSRFIVEEIEMPPIISESHQIHEKIYSKSLSYYFKEEFKKGTHLSEIMKQMIIQGESITMQDYLSSLEMQNKISKTLNDKFLNYDFIVSLATAGVAPLRDDLERNDPSLIWTLGHLPVISCPAFIGPKGLPFGLQFVSKKWSDYRLLEAVEELIRVELIPAGCNPVIQ